MVEGPTKRSCTGLTPSEVSVVFHLVTPARGRLPLEMSTVIGPAVPLASCT